MKVARNIRVSDDTRDWLLRHYMDPDVDNPEQLRTIPTLDYVLSTKDGAGNLIGGPGHVLVRGRPDELTEEIVSPFDNGRKFLAIQFDEPFDEEARYLIEYFDRVWYILKE